MHKLRDTTSKLPTITPHVQSLCLSVFLPHAAAPIFLVPGRRQRDFRGVGPDSAFSIYLPIIDTDDANTSDK